MGEHNRVQTANGLKPKRYMHLFLVALVTRTDVTPSRAQMNATGEFLKRREQDGVRTSRWPTTQPMKDFTFSHVSPQTETSSSHGTSVYSTLQEHVPCVRGGSRNVVEIILTSFAARTRPSRTKCGTWRARTVVADLRHHTLIPLLALYLSRRVPLDICVDHSSKI